MAGLLDENYGVADARRERLTKRIAIGAVAVIAVAGLLYYVFRNYKEEQRVREFAERLKAGQMEQAYAMWGCTAATPCRDYSMERFLEDWGPGAKHGKMDAAKLAKVKSGDGGIIQTIEYGPGDEVLLWVNRSDLTLGFAPWPVCNPRYQTPK